MNKKKSERFHTISQKKAREIDLAEIWPLLQSYRIRVIEVIGFSREVGPYLKFYAEKGYTKHIKKLKTDPSFAAEISVIGTYAKEVRLHTGEKWLIRPFNKKRNRFIIFEILNWETLTKKKKNQVRRLLRRLSQKITTGTSNEIKRILKEEIKKMK